MKKLAIILVGGLFSTLAFGQGISESVNKLNGIGNSVKGIKIEAETICQMEVMQMFLSVEKTTNIEPNVISSKVYGAKKIVYVSAKSPSTGKEHKFKCDFNTSNQKYELTSFRQES